MLNARSLLGGIIAVGLTGLLAGCEEPGRNLTPIKGWAQFEAQVLRNPRPVLIAFGKDPCPTCEIRKAELDEMYPEFKDRVFFAKMNIMVGMFEVTEPQVRDRYKLDWVPTVVLFVGGKEIQRWNLNIDPAFMIADTLRKELAKLPQSPPQPRVRPARP